MTTLSALEAAKEQASRILGYATILRAGTMPVPGTPARVMSYAEMVSSPALPRGCPSVDDSLSEIYEEGLRFWAEATAPQLTMAEWDEMVEHAISQNPTFPEDAVRFFENQFEGLMLADGSEIWP